MSTDSYHRNQETRFLVLTTIQSDWEVIFGKWRARLAKQWTQNTKAEKSFEFQSHCFSAYYRLKSVLSSYRTVHMKIPKMFVLITAALPPPFTDLHWPPLSFKETADKVDAQ